MHYANYETLTEEMNELVFNYEAFVTVAHRAITLDNQELQRRIVDWAENEMKGFNKKIISDVDKSIKHAGQPLTIENMKMRSDVALAMVKALLDGEIGKRDIRKVYDFFIEQGFQYGEAGVLGEVVEAIKAKDEK